MVGTPAIMVEVLEVQAEEAKEMMAQMVLPLLVMVLEVEELGTQEM